MIIDSFSPQGDGSVAGPIANVAEPRLFRSFWMGGFECATHINSLGHRLDMIAGTQHDVQAEHDYALLQTMGMRAARDGIRWNLIDCAGNGNYDWSSFEPMFLAAARQGVQVIWDICHYGWPDDLNVFSPEFIHRFARYSRAVAQFIKDRSAEVPFFAPMNEINFLAWGASRDFIFPCAHGKDFDLKRQFVRAAIAGMEAILDVDPRARFVFPEPTIHVVRPRNRPGAASLARQHHESQFEAWDMLAGFRYPELGGAPKYLDILGSNFYASNQWEVPGGRRLIWDREKRDPRWKPLHLLLADIYQRYRRPLFIAETSHVGVGRGEWIQEIADEVYLARQGGTPIEGICLYPVIDRYDWQHPTHWHNSGLWDFSHGPDGKKVRVLNHSYAVVLRESQRHLQSIGCF